MLKTAFPAVAAFLLSMAVGAGFAKLRAGGGAVDPAAMAETLAGDSTQVAPALEEHLDAVEGVSEEEGEEATDEGGEQADSVAVAVDPAATPEMQPQETAAADDAAAEVALSADETSNSGDAGISGSPLMTATLPPLTPDDSARQAQLGRIFAAMQPRDAARVLEQMDDADVVRILGMLRERQAAAVLSNLPPERAAAISRIELAGGNRP